MLRMYHDGVRALIIPDCAKCILEDKNPVDMEECPAWKCEEKDMCDGDCEYYTEEWGRVHVGG